MANLTQAADRALNKLIKNDDQPLNWFVVVIAKKHQVNEFQCRTPEAAKQAAELIKKIRSESGLPTERATRKQLLSGRGRSKEFGPTVEIDLE